MGGTGTHLVNARFTERGSQRQGCVIPHSTSTFLCGSFGLLGNMVKLTDD